MCCYCGHPGTYLALCAAEMRDQQWRLAFCRVHLLDGDVTGADTLLCQMYVPSTKATQVTL